jgi:hypothetical protein
VPKAFDDAELVLPTDVVLTFNFETRCCRRRNALGRWRRAHISCSGGRRWCFPCRTQAGRIEVNRKPTARAPRTSARCSTSIDAATMFGLKIIGSRVLSAKMRMRIRFATTSWSTTCLGARPARRIISLVHEYFPGHRFTESPCPSQARVERPIYSLQNLAWAAPRQRLAEPRPSTNVDAMSLLESDAAYQLRRDRA